MKIAWKSPSMVICIVGILIPAGLACRGSEEDTSSNEHSVQEVHEGVPTLIDLGSLTCVPCQMMEDELSRLEELTGDGLTVTFIDVNQDQSASSQYGIRVIPTQIFLAPDGSELYRHEGYISAEQMLAQWITLGYDLNVAEEDTHAP